MTELDEIEKIVNSMLNEPVKISAIGVICSDFQLRKYIVVNGEKTTVSWNPEFCTDMQAYMTPEWFQYNEDRLIKELANNVVDYLEHVERWRKNELDKERG